MAIELYLEDQFCTNDIEFIIKVFHDNEKFEYIIKPFFANGEKANRFSYSVSYNTKADLLASTGDNAISRLIERAKDDIKEGFYFPMN